MTFGFRELRRTKRCPSGSQVPTVGVCTFSRGSPNPVELRDELLHQSSWDTAHRKLCDLQFATSFCRRGGSEPRHDTTPPGRGLGGREREQHRPMETE